MTYDAWSFLKKYHPHMVYYLLIILLPQQELVVFLLRAHILFLTSVKLLPGYVQPSSQGIHL